MISTIAAMALFGEVFQQAECRRCESELVLTPSEYQCLVRQIDDVIEKSRRRGRSLLRQPFDQSLCSSAPKGPTGVGPVRGGRTTPLIADGGRRFVYIATADLECVKERPILFADGEETVSIDFDEFCGSAAGGTAVLGAGE